MVASVSKKQLLLLRKTNEKQSYCTSINYQVLNRQRLAFFNRFCTRFSLRISAFRLRSKLGLRGPKPNLLFGNVLEFIDPNVKWEEDQSVLFKKLKRQYGDVYGIYLGPQLNVVVTDLDVARDILIKNFSCFTDRSNIAILEKKPMSECLFNLRQQEWKDIRSTVVHTFSNRIMREVMHMASSCLPKIMKFLDGLDSYAASGTAFDIYKFHIVLTVDVIAQCAFALDLDLNESQNRQFLDNCRQLFDGYDFNESWLILIFPEMIWFLKPFVSFTKFSKAEQRIVNDLREVLLRKKHLKGTPLTDDAIVANAMVFLLAGYETSSTAMGFAAWLLAKHPEVQEKLRQEVNVKFNDIQIGQEYDVIHDMPYMNAVMQETLRLYPPLVLLVVRTCIKECTINEIPFVPGVQVLFPTYSIHHDETIWPEPDRFLPERFIGSDCAHHPMAWLPFGAGPRNCIGKRFAEMQFKITMAHLLKRYRLHLSEAESEDPIKLKCNGATIRPRNGVVIKLSRY
ncbi:putative thromboxane-A synthase [Trichinella spiralis]|uniref:putative thromboxane-A synthase n=1 Tax=Trichinella spiralis TaxID=6334 RepID=UPI0001EFC7EC|nr:putative thromboxane-A synthase [Trichinella spiralis]